MWRKASSCLLALALSVGGCLGPDPLVSNDPLNATVIELPDGNVIVMVDGDVPDQGAAPDVQADAADRPDGADATDVADVSDAADVSDVSDTDVLLMLDVPTDVVFADAGTDVPIVDVGNPVDAPDVGTVLDTGPVTVDVPLVDRPDVVIAVDMPIGQDVVDVPMVDRIDVQMITDTGPDVIDAGTPVDVVITPDTPDVPDVQTAVDTGPDVIDVPVDTGPRCGDGVCNGTETCLSCRADCPGPRYPTIVVTFTGDIGSRMRSVDMRVGVQYVRVIDADPVMNPCIGGLVAVTGGYRCTVDVPRLLLCQPWLSSYALHLVPRDGAGRLVTTSDVSGNPGAVGYPAFGVSPDILIVSNGTTYMGRKVVFFVEADANPVDGDRPWRWLIGGNGEPRLGP
ncbi:hypothetical protein KBA73_00115 [Patescibacteria group bacterium]|nr:hypothetical protein [Patescibacteria group bacterium]